MNDRRIILVTGVADYWGARVAQELVRNPDYHIIGLDNKPPSEPVGGLDFIQADIRNSLLAELLRIEGVNTVCHLKFQDTARLSQAAFDINIMGTINLLEASADADVRKVVVMSSTAVYGARPGNPAFITERNSLNRNHNYGYTGYLGEIEAFCEGYKRQSLDVQLTILRFANIVGPTATTPLTRFLSEPFPPVLLGFDPMLQIIHENDVIGALVHAIDNDVAGPYNIASEGVIPLSKLLAMVGKVPLPLFHPCAYKGVTFLRRRGSPISKYVPIELDFLRYPCVGDLTRMHNDLGFAPRYTAEETIREYVVQTQIRGYDSDTESIAQDEENLREIIERRKNIRDQRESNHGKKIQEDGTDE